MKPLMAIYSDPYNKTIDVIYLDPNKNMDVYKDNKNMDVLPPKVIPHRTRMSAFAYIALHRILGIHGRKLFQPDVAIS